MTAVSVLVLCLGMQWALLQTLAWTGMLIGFSAQGSFKEAVSKTFDGAHPCALCKVVKQGRSEERRNKQQQVKPGSKLELGLLWEPVIFFFDSERESLGCVPTAAHSRSEEPPKPRPRFVGQPEHAA